MTDVLERAQVGAQERIRDKGTVVEDLSDVGRLVYLMFQKTAEDVAALADVLFQEGRRTAEEALLQEAHAIGCGILQVRLGEGELLSWVRERADWAAQTICDTYNRDLAFAIEAVIAQYPKANRWVIAYHLRDWEAGRQSWKADQIATTEAFVTANEAKMEFYGMNAITEPKAWFGYSLICEQCQAIAAQNPYKLRDAQAIGLPHVGCLDQWHIEPGEMVECSELWLG